MFRTVPLAFALQALLLANACDVCKAAKEPPATLDFSNLRLSGSYLCEPAGSCKMTFQDSSAVLEVVEEGKRYRVTYAVTTAGTQSQRQEVVYQTKVGGNGRCSTTEHYRDETWTLPTIVLQQQRSEVDGQEAPLLAGTFVNRRPGPWYANLRTDQHFIDRRSGDAYVGVTLAGEGVGATGGDPLVVTRDGRPLQIGTRQ